MKNKLRKLIINKDAYFWRVYRHNCDGDGGMYLRIWKDKIIILDEFVSAKIGSAGITPGFIVKKLNVQTV